MSKHSKTFEHPQCEVVEIEAFEACCQSQKTGISLLDREIFDEEEWYEF